MTTATLQQLHHSIENLRLEIQQLRDCFHEDFLPLSDEARRGIAQARKRFARGQYSSHDDLGKKLRR